MNPTRSIQAYHAELTAVRRDLHQYPEVGFEEHRTSDVIARLLADWGIEVHRGIGGTGVVGVLSNGDASAGRVGLRADMDALPMEEEVDGPFRSTIPGRFHGCGHDGHVTILLGAARHLAETRQFLGTVNFIFQPAEEGLGGARAMLKDGLFERFPCDRIYGFHNWPGLPLGQAQVIPGPCMAGADFFDIVLRGTGSHGAMPHKGRDPIVAMAAMIGQLQLVVSRVVDPLDPAVLSVTKVSGGNAYNVIPAEVRIGGTIRFFSDKVRDLIRSEMARIVSGCAASSGIEADLSIRDIFSVTLNDAKAVDEVLTVSRSVLGAEAVHATGKPSAASEDFADMLQAVPGAYFMIGHRGDMPLHHPRYWFDDACIPIGATILARLVEERLPPR